MTAVKNQDIIGKLRAEILQLQGFKPSESQSREAGLEWMCECFPNSVFPVGAVHEFLTESRENDAASGAFITGILSSLMHEQAAVVWISSSADVFPPSLQTFGVQPERFIFVKVGKEKDVAWVMEEALKCPALTAVVAELEDISFTASRRLQLAVEQSLVTGFVLRKSGGKPGTTACVSRWRISSRQSAAIGDLPGVGLPSWRVELLRIRNGKPGVWNVIWTGKKFELDPSSGRVTEEQQRKVG